MIIVWFLLFYPVKPNESDVVSSTLEESFRELNSDIKSEVDIESENLDSSLNSVNGETGNREDSSSSFYSMETENVLSESLYESFSEYYSIESEINTSFNETKEGNTNYVSQSNIDEESEIEKIESNSFQEIISNSEFINAESELSEHISNEIKDSYSDEIQSQSFKGESSIHETVIISEISSFENLSENEEPSFVVSPSEIEINESEITSFSSNSLIESFYEITNHSEIEIATDSEHQSFIESDHSSDTISYQNSESSKIFSINEKPSHHLSQSNIIKSTDVSIGSTSDENSNTPTAQSSFSKHLNIVTLTMTLLLIAVVILVSVYYCRHLKFREDDEIEFTRAIIGDDAFEFSQMATI